MGARGIAAAGETPVQRRGERWRYRPGSEKPGKVWKKVQAWEGEEGPFTASLASQRKLLWEQKKWQPVDGHTLLGRRQTLSLRSDQELGSPSDPGPGFKCRQSIKDTCSQSSLSSQHRGQSRQGKDLRGHPISSLTALPSPSVREGETKKPREGK